LIQFSSFFSLQEAKKKMKALKGQNKRRQAEVVDNAESALAQCTRCNTLQRIATHCYTAAHYSTLQHIATHCNALQHSAVLKWVTISNPPWHKCSHCNTLQHSATLCNALHHTASMPPPHTHTSAPHWLKCG